jgi:hypothetical protein
VQHHTVRWMVLLKPVESHFLTPVFEGQLDLVPEHNGSQLLFPIFNLPHPNQV